MVLYHDNISSNALFDIYVIFSKKKGLLKKILYLCNWLIVIDFS